MKNPQQRPAPTRGEMLAILNTLDDESLYRATGIAMLRPALENCLLNEYDRECMLHIERFYISAMLDMNASFHGKGSPSGQSSSPKKRDIHRRAWSRARFRERGISKHDDPIPPVNLVKLALSYVKPKQADDARSRLMPLLIKELGEMSDEGFEKAAGFALLRPALEKLSPSERVLKEVSIVENLHARFLVDLIDNPQEQKWVAHKDVPPEKAEMIRRNHEQSQNRKIGITKLDNPLEVTKYLRYFLKTFFSRKKKGFGPQSQKLDGGLKSVKCA